MLSWKKLDQRSQRICFGSRKNVGVVEDHIGRVNKGVKASDAMHRIWKARSMGINMNRVMSERMIVLIVLLGMGSAG